jgi:hypothetical protein
MWDKEFGSLLITDGSIAVNTWTSLSKEQKLWCNLQVGKYRLKVLKAASVSA